MKVALLGDLHWGVRKDSPVFHEFMGKFFREEFFPYLKEHNIDTVIQAGDLFDNRKSVSPLTLQKSKEYFFDVMQDRNITCHAIIGNHDAFYRNSIILNSPDQFLNYSNLHLYATPTDVSIGGKSFLMLPWVCEENYLESKRAIVESSSDYCISHLELNGFIMQKGGQAFHGDKSYLSADDFKAFKQVYTGHFHTQSKNGNIHYIGIPFEMTWVDYADQKGFFVLDTITGELEFVPTKATIYSRFDMTKGQVVDRELVEGHYVKLIVDAATNRSILDTIYGMEPIDVKVVDLSTFETDASSSVDELETYDEINILRHLVDESNADSTMKKKMMTYLENLVASSQ